MPGSFQYSARDMEYKTPIKVSWVKTEGVQNVFSLLKFLAFASLEKVE